MKLSINESIQTMLRILYILADESACTQKGLVGTTKCLDKLTKEFGLLNKTSTYYDNNINNKYIVSTMQFHKDMEKNITQFQLFAELCREMLNQFY